MSKNDHRVTVDARLSSETSYERTERLVTTARALLANGDQSIAQSEAVLKESRALASANAVREIRDLFSRFCMDLANEMTDTAFAPTVDQVQSWRDRLITTAIATTNTNVAKSDGTSAV